MGWRLGKRMGWDGLMEGDWMGWEREYGMGWGEAMLGMYVDSEWDEIHGMGRKGGMGWGGGGRGGMWWAMRWHGERG